MILGWFTYIKGMGGLTRPNQNVMCCMTNIHSKKWRWPIFRFSLDVVVNNAFQLHKVQDRSFSQFTTHDHLGFRAISAVYLSSSLCAETPKRFSESRPACKVPSNISFNPKDHQIAKETQCRCALGDGITLYFCKKCKVGLPPDFHKSFHLYLKAKVLM